MYTTSLIFGGALHSMSARSSNFRKPGFASAIVIVKLDRMSTADVQKMPPRKVCYLYN